MADVIDDAQEREAQYLAVCLDNARTVWPDGPQERDAALTACEWLVIRHRDQSDAGGSTTLTAAQYKELLTYRQALRDWPTTSGWPDAALPTPPDFVK